MLKHTFLHIPGIGEKTERKLWADSFLCWEDYLSRGKDCELPWWLRDNLTRSLKESMRALDAYQVGYFDKRLPASEAWRLYGEFRNRAAFLDIETTGLYPGGDVITVIGLFDGRKAKSFVRGKNLHEFAAEIKKYPLLVTFNGKRFDLPFICQVFGRLPEEQGHIDLLYSFRRLGYQGGLKSIESQLGLEREGALKEMNGYLAVLLWQEYQRGNKKALETLVRYNLEDVVNLQYLADVAYNEALARLPIRLEPLPVSRKYQLATPFDTNLIHRLRGRARPIYY
ncbi:MAG: ribonuclease H-like domain-containing protein [Chloroflexota bacterium]